MPYLFEVSSMALEALKAEIALLLEMMGNAPHDRYEFYIQLQEKLNEFRVFGNTPPDDFLQLEAELYREFLRARRPDRPSHPDNWKGFNSPQPQAPPVCVRPHLP